jgi:3-keto-5-aminohexanoate cleavage enzyme
MDDLIICVAPHPGERPGDLQGRMNLPDEVYQSFNEGASVVHLHVRDEKGKQISDTTFFRKQIKAIRSLCPIIIEGSTGGTTENTLQERSVSLTVPEIEMGSLNMGSINMNGGVYKNPISDIRFYAREMKSRKIKPFFYIFDLSMFHNVIPLKKEGIVSPPFVYGFIFDVPDALPFNKKYLDLFLEQLPKGAPWFLLRHHSRGWRDFREALERGGHIRVGFEDSPFISSGKRARSNAELVKEIVETATRMGRKVVGPDRAREILGIHSPSSNPTVK